MRTSRRGGARGTALLLIAAFLCTPPAVWAADSPSLALVRPGSPWLSPEAEPTTGGDAPSQTDPEAPRRGRATKTGMWIGGITGALVGAAFFPFVIALGESSSDPNTTGDYILGALGGAAVFGLIGGGIGALIGSAIPGKAPEAETPAPSSPPASPTVPTESKPSKPASVLGSLALTTGVDALTGSEEFSIPTTGLSIQGALLGEFLEGRFALGAEGGYSWVANGLFSLGGLAQVRLTDEGLRPYGVFAMGWDNWSSQYPEWGGASLVRLGVGAGLRLRLGKKSEIQLETRYNWTAQNIDEPGNFSYISVDVGPRFSW